MKTKAMLTEEDKGELQSIAEDLCEQLDRIETLARGKREEFDALSEKAKDSKKGDALDLLVSELEGLHEELEAVIDQANDYAGIKKDKKVKKAVKKDRDDDREYGDKDDEDDKRQES